MHAKTIGILVASLLSLVACGEERDRKPAMKFVDNVAPIESLGFTIDRPATVKLGEVRSSTPHDTCCKEVDLQAPGGGFLGRLSTINVPHYYKNLDDYIAEVHGANTVVKKELLRSGAFYVEYREPTDDPKSTVRVKSAVKTATSSADCYAAPNDDELELARAVCRSLRPLAASPTTKVSAHQ